MKKDYLDILKLVLFEKLDNWKKIKPIRGKNRRFLQITKKQGLNLREIHK